MFSKTKAKLKALAFTLLATSVLCLSSASHRTSSFHVTDSHDVKYVSAVVLSADGHLGSSTLLRSGPEGSDFLTNEHVCTSTTYQGGAVVLNGKQYYIESVKPSRRVDLCLIHVKEDLKLNTEISPTAPQEADEILAGGYPLGLNMVVEKGYLGRLMDMGMGQGASRLVITTSLMVQHGSSGTGIFNKQGQIVAVVVAMMDDGKSPFTMGFGCAVPYAHVKGFVEKEAPMLPWIAVPHVKGS